MLFFTVICLGLAAFEIWQLSWGWEWLETNGETDDHILVELVLGARAEAIVLVVIAYVLTWLNNLIMESYLLSSPVAFFTLCDILFLYQHFYAQIMTITNSGIECEDTGSEFGACERSFIMNQSNVVLIIDLVLISALIFINQAVQMAREAIGSKEPSFFKYVKPNSDEHRAEYVA